MRCRLCKRHVELIALIVETNVRMQAIVKKAVYLLLLQMRGALAFYILLLILAVTRTRSGHID